MAGFYTYPVTTPISEVMDATFYQWEVPTGVSIVSGIGTTSIIVDWGETASGQICVSALNDCGASSGETACMEVTLSIDSGVADVENKPFKIFPNPGSHYLNIEFSTSTNYQVTCLDVLGNAIFIDELNGHNRLFIGDLSAGVYFFKIRNGQQSFIEKVIVDN